MKPQRVLALVHKGLEPPDEKVDKTTAQTAEWRMEYDVVRTLKVLGHEIRVIGVHDDLTPIRTTMDEFKPTIVFNLMEAFADIGVFDQNVVSYLELLRMPYTGCNPRGLTLTRDKALARALPRWRRISRVDDVDAYVRRMVVNAHTSWWRRFRRWESPVEEVRDQHVAPPGEAFDERRRMWLACRQLPESQRTAIVLRYYEQLDYPEIAELLGLREGSVRARVSRGLAALREVMGDEDE